MGVARVGGGAAPVVTIKVIGEQAEVDDDLYGVGEFEAGQLTFSQWLALLDKEVARITDGFSHDDFNDWGFADAFGDGVEPVQAARDMLAEDVTGQGYLEFAGIEGGWL